MREKNKKQTQETETAFAAAMLLLNLLLVAVICGTLWSLQVLFAEYSPLTTIMRGDFVP